MKAAVGRCGGVASRRWGSPWTSLPLATTAALVGTQVRAKHYISYRLEGEDDPYRHLRRQKSPSKKKKKLKQQAQHDEELQMMDEAEEEATRSSSSLASFLFGPKTQRDEEPQGTGEAATSQRDAELASGLGAGGGVVHRSKGAMPFRRPSLEGGVGGQQTRGQAQGASERGGGGEDRRGAESRAMMADRPRVEGEDHEPVFWVPQAVKETGKKVLERVGDAAASVGHTAKQLWVGALARVGARPAHQHHHGLVEKAKDVGKDTAHVVDTGYEKTVEKAADKMLEALDASLKSAKARGFPPGLTVTTIASVMGAQLIMAYTTKEEDVKTESGRKDLNAARPKQQPRKTAQPRHQRKESEKSKQGAGEPVSQELAKP